MTDRAELPVTLATLQAAASRLRWENRLDGELRRAGLPAHIREHEFAKALGRNFRLDFAWPERLVAVEVQGGGWMTIDENGNRRGAHGGGAALERDCEKHALAAALGWRVVPVTPAQIKDGRAVTWIRAVLEMEEEAPGPERLRRAFAIKGSPAAWGISHEAPASTGAPVKARVMG